MNKYILMALFGAQLISSTVTMAEPKKMTNAEMNKLSAGDTGDVSKRGKFGSKKVGRYLYQYSDGRWTHTRL